MCDVNVRLARRSGIGPRAFCSFSEKGKSEQENKRNNPFHAPYDNTNHLSAQHIRKVAINLLKADRTTRHTFKKSSVR